MIKQSFLHRSYPKLSHLFIIKRALAQPAAHDIVIRQPIVHILKNLLRSTHSGINVLKIIVLRMRPAILRDHLAYIMGSLPVFFIRQRIFDTTRKITDTQKADQCTNDEYTLWHGL